MKTARAKARGRRTSYLDRTWLNRWTVLTIAPIVTPSLDELRGKMVDFMTADPTHPLCCTLEDGGKRWRPVPRDERWRHVKDTIVSGGPYYLDDPFAYLDQHRPDEGSTAPFKVMVGPDSMTFYFLHACGDASVFSPFSVLMSLGDVDGLRALRGDAGLPVATKILFKEARPHWREWWNHLRSSHTAPAAPGDGEAHPVTPRPNATTAVGTVLDATAFAHVKAWRKQAMPGVATTALMASATYLALAAEGVPVNPRGLYTLVDLRRHLPQDQSSRPGNLAKGVFIPADLGDPTSVGAGLKQLVSSARAVPALFSGALAVALRRTTPSPVAGDRTEEVTMTFNSMMRNPGADDIPWTDPSEASYVTMSYPSASDGISVSACAIAGRLLFSASFDPNRIDAHAVDRALKRLLDIPALFTESSMADELVAPVPQAPAGSGVGQ
ncbi:hypothetical protein H7K45_09785 [Mycobacterium yunnanensis]|uniref:Uncharacterized protein n=1 Tax=Mycobacterium yunnanensis TaxID=368477 RepID=A0A9X2Z2D1_9MYCO|nr:hypothetical protein [Mycobacterium yunnanensis]MCV7420827.1 hypothetical protein [Mycobacterium yunnanensis]